LAAEIPRFADQAFVWIIDKRFCLLTELVDYLVEPGAYEAGFDWYADGWGLRYLNTIHRDLVTHGADELYNGVIRSWDAFARDPSSERLDAFQVHLERGRRRAKRHCPASSNYSCADWNIFGEATQTSHTSWTRARFR
jgi:hypothetical protein